MNSVRWLLGLSTALTVTAAVAGGCGSSNSGTSADSGTGEDATNDGPSTDAPSTDGKGSDAACVPDANVLSLPLPDGEASCFACLEQSSTCGSVLMQCAAECTCSAAFETFVSCVASGGAAGFLNCSFTFSTSVPGGAGNFLCAATCATQCAGISLDGGLPGMDGGTTTDSAPAGDSGPTEDAPSVDSATGDSSTPSDGAAADGAIE